MSEKVRVGVIGTSWYADLFHLPSLKSHPRAELAAICGRNSDRAKAMANKYEIPSVFSDYRAMIEKGNLQAVVVATPDDLHYPMTMEALDAGMHVVCEKPLSLNIGQAREMYKKAEAVGVKHMVPFSYRWIPLYRYLKNLVDENYIGRCFHCNIRYLGGHGRQNQYAWRFDRKRSNGVLGDLGSHMIDLARWIFGDIAKVSCHLATFVDREPPEGRTFDPANDSAHLALEFENGSQGMIHISAVCHTGDRIQEQHVSFHGEAGTLEADYAMGKSAEIRGVRSEEEIFQTLLVPESYRGDVDQTKPLISQIIEMCLKQSVGDRLFIDAILEDRPVSPNFYDGLKAQEVIDSAIKSHNTERWTSIEKS